MAESELSAAVSRQVAESVERIESEFRRKLDARAHEMMRLFAALFLTLLTAIAAGSQESAAQGISDCPQTPFQGGYCRFDPKNQTAIVFVHGVLGDYKATWTNDRSKRYWPALLAKDAAFNDANIWVHSFASPKIDVAQKVEELAARLGDYLDADGVISGHSHVVFVAHSMGGLVVRALLIQRRISPDRVPLIYFFGTPSAGANTAQIPALVTYNPQFRDMLPFGRGGYVENLATRWLSTSVDQLTGYPRTIWSYCAYEKKPILGTVIVVEELSATFLCNVQARAVLSDHIDMVKPEDRTAEPYTYFKAAYQFWRSEVGKNAEVALSLSLTAFGPPVELGKFAERAFRLKREPVRPISNVACKQQMSELLEVPLKVEPEEEVVAVRPIWVFRNLSRHLFAIERIRGNLVMLRYLVEGLPLFLNACPGEGNAQGFVNYVTSRPVR